MGDSYMVKLEKDLSKSTFSEIEGRPGRLAAQIVWNELVENEMFAWFIGNTDGNLPKTAFTLCAGVPRAFLLPGFTHTTGATGHWT